LFTTDCFPLTESPKAAKISGNIPVIGKIVAILHLGYEQISGMVDLI